MAHLADSQGLVCIVQIGVFVDLSFDAPSSFMALFYHLGLLRPNVEVIQQVWHLGPRVARLVQFLERATQLVLLLIPSGRGQRDYNTVRGRLHTRLQMHELIRFVHTV